MYQGFRLGHPTVLTVLAGLAALTALTPGCAPADDSGQATEALTARSVVPVINGSMQSRLRSVYLTGQSMGNRPGVFAKVGDSITATGSFLVDIGCGVQDLGGYSSLGATVSFFSSTGFPSSRTSSWCGVGNSFSIDSVAAASGWTTDDVLATLTPTPSDCPAPYNTALLCELHRDHPSVVLVMIGTNDLERINDLGHYHTGLTQIVQGALNAGVIPVLSTVPPRLDSATLNSRVGPYNDMVGQVASEQQVPLWDFNLALAASSMLNHGVGSDGIHPNIYQGENGAIFTTAGLQYGYNQRNLTALQVLAHLKAVVFDNGTPDQGGVTDAGVTDAGVTDTGVDAGRDTGVDAGRDTGPTDTGPTDTGVDAGTPDAGGAHGVVPTVTAAMQSRLRAVYLSGQSAGNREAVFTRVGDDLTTSGAFLVDIGCGVEDLGGYGSLGATVSYFSSTRFPSSRTSAWCGASNPFTIDSAAASAGWTVADVESPYARAPSDCPSPYNTPLRCALHRDHPSLALVMFGTYDLQAGNDTTAFRSGLTQIVTDALNAGVIPVVSTIPPRLDDSTYGGRVGAYNAVVASVAQSQGVPLWDYNLALAPSSVLNHGIGPDGIQPSIYQGDNAVELNSAGLRYGFNQRNLTALQVLAHLKAVVFDNGTPDPG